MGETFGRIRSLIRADSAADRRLHKDAGATTAAPTSRGDFRHMQGARYLHVYSDLTNATALQVTVWFYSDVAGQLFEGSILDLFVDNGRSILEINGEDLVHIQISTIAGATVAANIWAGGNIGGN